MERAPDLSAVGEFERNVLCHREKFARDAHLQVRVVCPFTIWGEHYTRAVFKNRARFSYVTPETGIQGLSGLSPDTHAVVVVESGRFFHEDWADKDAWRELLKEAFAITRRSGITILRVFLP